jgi:hypothetical protein
LVNQRTLLPQLREVLVDDHRAEQRKGRAQPPHGHTRLVQGGRVARLDNQLLVPAELPQAGGGDGGEALGRAHFGIEIDAGRLDADAGRLPSASAQPRSAW